jgi:hypothetical protein
MRKARVFLHLNGFFTDAKGGTSWAHKRDEEKPSIGQGIWPDSVLAIQVR